MVPVRPKVYEEDLIARCEAIAAGAAHSQGCREIIDPALPANLRFTRAGGHLIIFVKMDSEVVITDFLHPQRDLPRRLADPGGRNTMR
ncbi:type II toxin-antitoxin system RelE/ParE family toxin [Aureimonas populi]|uniref:Type II toxin-antitoxin system RelE/ParE family toxin n=1 Tax=Aureimonas populi TaxID=1701758 RepID=A0ABW5CLI3_9HYPH|nr:type II toxin-antitoxin system RelE/ParE family toxin [Aureimonas populi]